MKFSFYQFFIVWLVPPLLALAAPEKLNLRLAEFNTVQVGQEIQLGDLVDISLTELRLSPAKLELLQRVLDVRLLSPISEEIRKTYSSQELVFALREKLSFQDLQLVLVKMPTHMTVQAKVNYLNPRTLQRKITQEALSFCTGCDVEIDDLKIPDLKQGLSYDLITVDVPPFKQGGAFLLPLTAIRQGVATRFWVTGRLSLYREAYVAQKMLKVGNRLTEADLELKKVNVTFAKDGYPTLTELVGRSVSRTLNVGQAVLYGDLKKEMAATRGQPIKIVMGEGQFEISTMAIAEDSGALGDQIRVRTQDTKKTMTGVLIEPGTVRVQ